MPKSLPARTEKLVRRNADDRLWLVGNSTGISHHGIEGQEILFAIRIIKLDMPRLITNPAYDAHIKNDSKVGQ